MSVDQRPHDVNLKHPSLKHPIQYVLGERSEIILPVSK